MRLIYSVSCVRGENGEEFWYAHRVGFPNIPVMSERGTFGSRRHAMQIAADSMGLPYREYMMLRATAR